MLSYEELKHRPKDLLAATGLTVKEFEALLPGFAEVYQTRFGIEQTCGGESAAAAWRCGRESSVEQRR